MSYKLTLFKNLKNEDGKILDLPKGVKVKGGKRSFCLTLDGDHFTPMLAGIEKKKADPGYLLTAKTKSGPYVKIDVKSAKTSIPYLVELTDNVTLMVITPDKRFVVLDDDLKPHYTGYKFVAECEEKEETYYIVKREDVKPENEKFGIIGPEGNIICPPRFYTKDLKVEKCAGMFYLISSDAKNSKQVLTKYTGLGAKISGAEVKANSVLLAGDQIIQLESFQSYYNRKVKPNAPFCAVYNKQTNRSEIYCYDKAEFSFESMGSVPGCVAEVIEEDTYKKFYYITCDQEHKGRLVSVGGKVSVDVDEVAKVDDIMYSELRRDHGRIICPPYGISMHTTTEAPFVILRNGKMGLFDATLDKVMLAPEYKKILIATKTASGEGRFLVENDKKHFGVVNSEGKSIVPFTMTNFEAIKEIDFDQGKRFVAKMGIETRKGLKNVYVDPATETGLASALEIKRILEQLETNYDRGTKPVRVGLVEEKQK